MSTTIKQALEPDHIPMTTEFLVENSESETLANNIVDLVPTTTTVKTTTTLTTLTTSLTQIPQSGMDDNLLLIAIMASIAGVFILGLAIVLCFICRRKTNVKDRGMETMYENSNADEVINAYEGDANIATVSERVMDGNVTVYDVKTTVNNNSVNVLNAYEGKYEAYDAVRGNVNCVSQKANGTIPKRTDSNKGGLNMNKNHINLRNNLAYKADKTEIVRQQKEISENELFELNYFSNDMNYNKDTQEKGQTSKANIETNRGLNQSSNSSIGNSNNYNTNENQIGTHINQNSKDLYETDKTQGVSNRTQKQQKLHKGIVYQPNNPSFLQHPNDNSPKEGDSSISQNKVEDFVFTMLPTTSSHYASVPIEAYQQEESPNTKATSPYPPIYCNSGNDSISAAYNEEKPSSTQQNSSSVFTIKPSQNITYDNSKQPTKFPSQNGNIEDNNWPQKSEVSTPDSKYSFSESGSNLSRSGIPPQPTYAPPQPPPPKSLLSSQSTTVQKSDLEPIYTGNLPHIPLRRKSKTVREVKNRSNNRSSSPHYANISTLNHAKVSALYSDMSSTHYADIDLSQLAAAVKRQGKGKSRGGTLGRPHSFSNDYSSMHYSIPKYDDNDLGISSPLYHIDHKDMNDKKRGNRSSMLSPEEVAELYAVPAAKNGTSKKSRVRSFSENSDRRAHMLVYHKKHDQTRKGLENTPAFAEVL